MNIQDGYNSSKKVVTFDTQDRLNHKLHKFTFMMSKLTVQCSSQNTSFKLEIYQGKRRGKARSYYDQDRYQNRYRANSGDRKMSYRGTAQYGQNYRGRLQYDQNYRSDSRTGNFRGVQNCRGQNFRGGYRGNFRNNNLGRGRSRFREKTVPGNITRNDRSSSRSRSGSRESTNKR